ncbi:MAG TPA: peptidase M6 [Patescibacteria group bacterium]|nr:peptidase M6 [Patescibacteria group bacterium]
MMIKKIDLMNAMTATIVAVLSLGSFACSCGCAETAGVAVRSDPWVLRAPGPLDPQVVRDQQEMTWSDYHPIPGKNWADPGLVPQRVLRIALVAVDFEDQPFVITLPKGSDPFGNPQVDPVPREKVPQFYAAFYNKPGELNHGQTINGFWMEQSRGKIGIPPLDAYGPYRMPKKLFQYGLNEWDQQGGCPPGYVCDGELEADADALWRAAAGENIAAGYDIVLRIYAGYDETSVWQEFGEMKFQSPEHIPPAWGNPDAKKPRWVTSRYVPWTSWKAGQMQWGLSSMRQGENSGTITHEIAHYAFATGDNNNNPYSKPYRRVGSGPWDIMDRGSFNGPGGPHRRWVVPAAEGAAMPAGFMLRNRLRFGFVSEAEVLQLGRDGLACSGLVVAEIAARAVAPAPGRLAGIIVRLDGAAPQDRTPPCDPARDPLCAGASVFNFYSIEAVQRIGYDSFTPDNGVLIAKNKDEESSSCGYGCFTWVIDAHPEDSNMVDFKRPDGTAVMRTIADYRQLNDALFHAGSGSGSSCEWLDAANRLHFYVIDLKRDAFGILSYIVGVRSLDGSGPQQRGVALTAPPGPPSAALPAELGFVLTNTGASAAANPDFPPCDASSCLDFDMYRLEAAVDAPGWTAALVNELAAVKSGDSQNVFLRVSRVPGSAATATVTLKARSESDPTQNAQVQVLVHE